MLGALAGGRPRGAALKKPGFGTNKEGRGSVAAPALTRRDTRGRRPRATATGRSIGQSFRGSRGFRPVPTRGASLGAAPRRSRQPLRAAPRLTGGVSAHSGPRRAGGRFVAPVGVAPYLPGERRPAALSARRRRRIGMHVVRDALQAVRSMPRGPGKRQAWAAAHALAWHADASGVATVGLGRLTAETGLDYRTLQRGFEELEAAGLLAR